MERYKVMRQLGDGTYGEVLKAQHKQTGSSQHRATRNATAESFRTWPCEFKQAHAGIGRSGTYLVLMW
jgi:serine/threonine protein kinase